VTVGLAKRAVAFLILPIKAQGLEACDARGHLQQGLN
jgi:hypothetical protein